MVKIDYVVLSGSPRKGGNTYLKVSAIVNGTSEIITSKLYLWLLLAFAVMILILSLCACEMLTTRNFRSLKLK